jgi:tRNA G46 methylase TrmB
MHIKELRKDIVGFPDTFFKSRKEKFRLLTKETSEKKLEAVLVNLRLKAKSEAKWI